MPGLCRTVDQEGFVHARQTLTAELQAQPRLCLSHSALLRNLQHVRMMSVTHPSVFSHLHTPHPMTEHEPSPPCGQQLLPQRGQSICESLLEVLAVWTCTPELCFPIWRPLTTGSYWALEMWLCHEHQPHTGSKQPSQEIGT